MSGWRAHLSFTSVCLSPNSSALAYNRPVRGACGGVALRVRPSARSVRSRGTVRRGPGPSSVHTLPHSVTFDRLAGRLTGKPLRGAEPARVLFVTAGVSVRDRSPLIIRLTWLSPPPESPPPLACLSLPLHLAAMPWSRHPAIYYDERQLRPPPPTRPEQAGSP